jgi:type III pantothenate kinase
MLLAVDVGNTNINLGIFQGDELAATWRWATDPERTPDEYAALLLGLLPRAGIDFSDIRDVALCSGVPPLVTTFQELCSRYFNSEPLVVGAGVKTGIKVMYENPRDVGADRICDAVAAHRLYGGPAIVVDCGTATVLDAITATGDYLGGAIAPGIQISIDALAARASLLRRVELVAPKQAIGRNTVHSMQAGIVFGYAGMVEALVGRFKDELQGNPRVIGTGGLVELIAGECPSIDAIDRDLTLHGLRIIHELNQ